MLPRQDLLLRKPFLFLLILRTSLNAALKKDIAMHLGETEIINNVKKKKRLVMKTQTSTHTGLCESFT